jgi:AP-1-like factor
LILVIYYKDSHVLAQLEDKVAALEAKNEQATSENVNLRDLLTRLQDENVSLKQAAFTFSVPKTTGNNQPVASGSGQSSMNLFNTPALNPTISPFSSPTTASSIKTPVFPDNMDWTSLTTFDPAVLSLLDDSSPQTTATDSAMNMDFGFGSNGQPQQSQFTTIAANPMFMSFADFDSSDSSDTNSVGSFNFDAWTNSPRPDAAATKDPGLDELFGGSYLGNQGPVDFNVLMMGSPATTLSPVVHHRSPGTATSGSSSSSNSTSIPSEGQSPISSVGTSPAADDKEHHNTCPKSKAEAAERVKALGESPFVTEQLNTQSAGDELMGKMVSCASGSSSLPSTEPKDDNVEVLAAWHGVIKDPNFKVTCLQSIHEFDHH